MRLANDTFTDTTGHDELIVFYCEKVDIRDNTSTDDNIFHHDGRLDIRMDRQDRLRVISRAQIIR